MVFKIMGITLLKSILMGLMVMPCWAHELWKNQNQQAYDLFQAKAYSDAEKLFNDSDWKGVSAYRNNDYAKAVSHLLKTQTADGFYNLGNAYAQQGLLEDAIKAYQKALLLDPQHVDATYNLQLLENEQQRQEEERKRQEEERKRQEEERKRQEEEERKRKEEEERKRQEQAQQQQQNQPNSSPEQQNQQGQQEQEGQQNQQNNQKELLSFVNEDPAGLLKQKFLRDYQKAQAKGSS
jgi:Ca-activated chloride channel family protein